MTICYKLTDRDGLSYGGTRWTPGIGHVASGPGLKFCSSDLIHLYSSPLLGVFLNPIHAAFVDPLGWKVEAEVVASDYGLKLGTKRAVCLEEIALPSVTLQQRRQFGILCALEVLPADQPWVSTWRQWAEGWLSNTDRSASAAWAASQVPPLAAVAWAAACAAAESAPRVPIATAAAVSAAAWRAYKAGMKSFDLLALAQRALNSDTLPANQMTLTGWSSNATPQP